jgi:hypothetical protein
LQLDERTTQALAAAAAGCCCCWDGCGYCFDIAAGEDGIEPMEEFAELAAGWQGDLAMAAVGPADGGGELKQVDWKTLSMEPVAGAGGAGDGMGHVRSVGYVVDVVDVGRRLLLELRRRLLSMRLRPRTLRLWCMQVVVVDEMGGKNLSGCAEIFGTNSEGEGVFGEAGHMQGKHILDGLSPA